jgi:hypothetical protein
MQKDNHEEQIVKFPVEHVSILRIMRDKFTNVLKAHSLPKYQNSYLGGGGGKLRVKNGGGVVIVKNCHYNPKLASYVYWCNAGGVMVTIPECDLEPVQHRNEED